MNDCHAALRCLALVARVHGVVADIEQLVHSLADTPSLGGGELQALRAAKRLGLKARAVSRSVSQLGQVAMPAILLLDDGGAVVVGGFQDGNALVQAWDSDRPERWDQATLEGCWSGRLILVTKRAGLGSEGRRFDISWFIPALKKYKKLFVEVLIASFFIQLLALFSPLLFQVIIDKVMVHRGLSSLDVIVFAMVMVAIFEVMLTMLRTYLFSHTTTRIDVELGAWLFNHLMAIPMAWFNARQVGTTVARVRELENIRDFLTGSALTLVVDLFFTFIFFAVMFHYAPLLAWVVLGSIPFYVIVSLVITPILRRRVEEQFQRGAKNTAFLTECVTGVDTVKALAVEPQMQRTWEEQLAGYTRSSFRVTQLGNIASNTTSFIQKLTTALTLWFGAHMVIANEMTVGQLVAFNMLAGRVAQPILRLAQLWQDFQQARISIERLGDILNTPVESTSTSQGSLPAITGKVDLEQVSFRYRPDGPEILKEFILHVDPGQVVGIVGPSGSGKSTLTKLIQRLYVPESGRVLVDGVDLSMVQPSWLRRQIGVVLQEDYLFNRSVRDNIALADPGMPMDRIIQAAELAGAHEFILQLPEGYDSLVGERGGMLSGGQRQRIAIARALLGDPKILIFDEATSALDYESERLVQENMSRISQGRTVFIIAHRLSAVRHADRIITVEKGRLTEDGNHQQLLKAGGRYAELWRHQTEGMDTHQATTESNKGEILKTGTRVVRNPVPIRGIQVKSSGEDSNS